MGDNAIRILLVEDDEDDYLITRDLLADIERISFAIDWAANPEEALAHLEASRYDICLLDFRLGRYNGLELIGIFRNRGFHQPIILLTGQDDWDTDQRALSAGASDYLVKGRIDSPSLERAIRYAIDQKRSEEALRQQTQFVTAILDTAGALVTVLDNTGRIVRFNRACEQTTGYAASEILGRFLWETVLSDSEAERIRQLIPTLTPDFFPNYIESFWQTRGGAERLISWSDTALLDSSGAVEYIVCTGIDVTEQRKAEQELKAAREREIEVGASIQNTLLVRRPPVNISGAEIGAYSLPSLKIGGDYFDFFVYSPDRFDVLVGDVMGKGVPAALLAAAAKSHFQRAVRRLCQMLRPYDRLPEPYEILAAVHDELTHELYRLDSYITLVYARFDLTKRLLSIVECGHPHPIWRHTDGSHAFLEGDNLPLGMIDGEVYTQRTVTFAPGDLFFFYSDGLTEAADTDDRLFGADELAEMVGTIGGASPQEVCRETCRIVRDFAKEAAPLDDLTCVAVRIADTPADLPLIQDRREITSSLDNLENACCFVERFLERAQSEYKLTTDDEWRMLFTLAANEAITNIVKHAYKERKNQYIQIEMEAYPAHILLRVYDWGERFDKSRVAPPDFDGLRENGFGVFIIEESMDSVDYTRDGLGRNVLLLQKNLLNEKSKSGQ